MNAGHSGKNWLRTADVFGVADDGVLDVLAKTDGLAIADPFRAVLSCGAHRAQVTIGADDWIHVVLESNDARDPGDCLADHAAAGGNVRFAQRRRRRVLLAETRIDGVAHLPASIGELRDELRDLVRTGERPAAAPAEPASAIATGTVTDAVAALAWDERVVELDGGWELRPQLAGETVPVRLRLERARLVFERRLVSLPVGGPCREAVVLQALRLNAEIRLARLALLGAEVVVETRLHAGLLGPAWIADAARAVAAAARHCRPTLEILRDDERVARCHVQVFGDS